MSVGRKSWIWTIGLAAAIVSSAIAPGALAATAYPSLGYDLDSSPTPTPPSLNQLDLYTPDAATAADLRPVVVYVHGGGWKTGDKHNQITNKVNLFTGAGYVFASVNYRLSPDPIDTSYPPSRIRFPMHPHDVGEAIGWIDRNVAAYGGDPTRILLIGHSAGAHLVSLVSTDPDYVGAYRVDQRHLIGTVSLDTDSYDLPKRVSTGSASERSSIYSAIATPAENALDDTWAQASPITFADEPDPEFLLVTGQYAPGRIQSAQVMASALGLDPASSVLTVPYNHEGINDAVGSPTDTAGETQAIMDFYARMVAASRTSAVTLTRSPAAKIIVEKGKSAKVSFRFEAETAAASYECRLDGRDFEGCASPAKYKAKQGKHTFRVRAIASNGDQGPLDKATFRVVNRKR
jgi:acetyl esterase/lipase